MQAESLQAVQAFAKIFAHDDPLRDPFRPDVQAKKLVYPTATFLTSTYGSSELERAMEKAADESFFLTVLEVEDDPLKRETRLFKRGEVDSYLEVATPFANAIYSSRSTWGVLFSIDGHATVGGVSAFVDNFALRQESDEVQAAEFYAEWIRLSDPNSPPDWARSLLVSLYGAQRASEMIAQARSAAT